ncbi:MAG TPA: EamA family transporter [Jatrophihabitans sp.]|jgi:DME family drug/metabolite transporter
MRTFLTTRIGLLQVCAAGVLWGTGGLTVQEIRRGSDMSPMVISAYRMVIAAVVLLVACLAMRILGQVRLIFRAHPWHAVLVGAGTGAYQALYFESVVNVGVTVSTVVSLAVAPVLLTVVDTVRMKVRPTRTRVLVLVAALAGLVLVSAFSGDGTTGPHPAIGVIEAVGSGTAYAITTIFGRTLARSYKPIVVATTMCCVGTAVLVPVAAILSTIDPSTIVTANGATMGWLVYLGIPTMALAYGLLYAGLRTTPESSAVIATLLEPVTAALAAAVVLGERLGVAGVVGTVLILVAVAGLEHAPEAAVATVSELS